MIKSFISLYSFYYSSTQIHSNRLNNEISALGIQRRNTAVEKISDYILIDNYAGYTSMNFCLSSYIILLIRKGNRDPKNSISSGFSNRYCSWNRESSSIATTLIHRLFYMKNQAIMNCVKSIAMSLILKTLKRLFWTFNLYPIYFPLKKMKTC